MPNFKEIRDNEYYQEMIELNAEQKKAFNSLKRAISKCRKANIYFYQSMDNLSGLNGHNVFDVCTDEDKGFRGSRSDSPNCIQSKAYPTVITECSFADDSHFVLLHDER